MVAEVEEKYLLSGLPEHKVFLMLYTSSTKITASIQLN